MSDKTNFSTPVDCLKYYWGFEKFRPLQKEIIQSILSNQDTLALLPTGGGKSICFQVPALMMDGVCIVISPLIALMKDQVHNLKRKKIPAEAIYSGISKKEQDEVLNKAVCGEIKFLYLSPERLASEDFRGWLNNMPLSFLAVDEAHCISQWGYDFRPEYLRIAEVRKYFPGKPVLALTASATPEVVKDMMAKLEFKSKQVFTKSFARNNLNYLVRMPSIKSSQILKAVNYFKGTGIIYTRNRKGTEQLANWLRKMGISADFYHAGLKVKERSKKQEDWINNKTRIMVCTNAFGMGIDKPDVRFVIHLEPPDCLEAYYQEAGRAGRDEQKAFCLLMYNELELMQAEESVAVRYPENEYINNIYQAIGNYLGISVGSGAGVPHEFELMDFCSDYHFKPREAYYAIDILHKQGFLNLSENGRWVSSLKINYDKNELYKLQVKDEKVNLLMLAMLRTRGGYFDFYTPVDEKQLALMLQIPIKDVVNQLKALHSKNVLDYLAKTDIPIITFLEPRYPKINVNRKEIEFLKEHFLYRLREMRAYIEEEKRCRNKLISDYFGEKLKKDCGTCDNCRRKYKAPFEKEKFNYFFNKVKEMLSAQEMDADEIAKAFKVEELEELQILVKWLQDTYKLIKDKRGNYKWVK